MAKKKYLDNPKREVGMRITEEEKDIIFRKLEPHLKTGIPVYLACHQVNIPFQSVYDIMKEDSIFAEKVKATKSYLSIVSTSIAYSMFAEITSKLSNKEKLDKEDKEYVKWFLVNFKANRDIYGQTQDLRHEGKVELNDIISSVKEVIKDNLDVSPSIQNSND